MVLELVITTSGRTLKPQELKPGAPTGAQRTRLQMRGFHRSALGAAKFVISNSSTHEFPVHHRSCHSRMPVLASLKTLVLCGDISCQAMALHESLFPNEY